jgi:hypothetical protein
MERWLNQEVKTLIANKPNVKLLNEYRGKSHVSLVERSKRAAFRTTEATAQIKALIAAVKAEVG